MPFFDSARLNWPAHGDINAWADFIETICMFSEGDTLSMEDFIDFLKDDPAKTNQQILTALNFNEHFLAVPVPVIFPPIPIAMPITGEDEDIEDEDDPDDDFDGDDEENEEREQIRSRLLILVEFIRTRSEYFGAFYPFEVIGGTHLRQRPGLTQIQQLYVIMMLSSEMNLFTAGDRNRIGHLFEVLCRVPFSYLLPANSEKRFFGAGAGTIFPASYNGNLRTRIEALANDLKIETNSIIEDPDELGPTGDAGLDWVGWVSFADDCDHQPVYFAQCACGANWVDKQHETALSVWRNFLNINQSVQCFHFMPRSFRRNSLEWFRRMQIVSDLTLIDRFRLLKIFQSAAALEITEVLDRYAELLNEAAVFEYEAA